MAPINETLRFSIETDTAPARTGIMSMVSDVGHSMQSAMGFAGQTMQSIGSAANMGFGAISGAASGMSGAMQYYGMGAAQATAATVQQAAGYRMAVHNAVMSGAIDAQAQAGGDQFMGQQPFGQAAGAAAFGAGVTAATAIGWGAASKLMPSAGTMWRAGRMLGGVKGIVAGGLMGAGTFMLPYMAVDAAVGMTVDDVVQQRQIANAIGAMSARGTNPLFRMGGTRFSAEQRADMASSVMSMASTIDREAILSGRPTMGVEGITQILRGSQEIFRDPSLSPTEFRRKFTEKVNMIREFAEMFDKSIAESVQITKALSGRHGMAPGTDPRQVAAMVGLSASTAGLTTTGMVGVAQAGVQSYAAAGITRNPLAAMTGAVQNVSDIAALQNLGIANRMDVRAMGGVQGFGQAVTQMQAQMMSGQMGNFLAALQMQGGNQLVQQAATGGVGMANMLQQAAGVAGGGLNQLSRFYSNMDVLKSNVSPAQQMAFMGNIALTTLNQLGMDTNQANMATFFQSQFGMNRIMARTMAQRIANAPDIYQAQQNAAYNQMYQRALDQERQSRATWGDIIGLREIRAGLVGARDVFRRNISEPVGGMFRGAGRAVGDWRERMLGIAEYNVTAENYRSLIEEPGVAEERYTGNRQEVIDRAWEERAGQIGAFVRRQYRMWGGANMTVAPDWLRRIANIGTMGSALVRDEVGGDTIARAIKETGGMADVIKAFKRERREVGDFMEGYRTMRKATAKEKKMFASATWTNLLQSISDKGGSKNRNPQRLLMEARNYLREAGVTGVSDVTIGRGMAEGGIGVQRMQTVAWDATIAKSAQRITEERRAEIEQLMTGKEGILTWAFGSERESILSAPGRYVLGDKAMGALKDMGTRAQVLAAQIIGIQAKKARDITDADMKTQARAGRELYKMMQDTKMSPEARRKLRVLYGVSQGDLNWNKDLIKKLRDSGVSRKLLGAIAGFEDMKSIEGLKKVSIEYSKRMSMMLSADKPHEKAFMRQLKKSGVTKQYKEILGDFIDIADGDVSKNIRALATKAEGKKFKQAIKIMKERGGASHKQAAWFLEKISSPKYQQENLLSFVDKQPGLKDKIREFNLEKRMQGVTNKKQLKELNRDFFKLIAGTGKHSKARLAEIESIAKDWSAKDRAMVIKNLAILSKDKSYLSRALLYRAASKPGVQVGRRVAGATNIGVFNATAAAQIEVMKKHISTLSQLQTTFASLSRALNKTKKRVGPGG